MAFASFSDERWLKWRHALDWAALAAGLSALALLVVEFGFPLTASRRDTLIVSVRLVLWALIVIQLLRLLVPTIRPDTTLRSRAVAVGFYVAAMLALLLERPAAAAAAQQLGGEPDRWGPLWLSALHVLLLAAVARRLLLFNQLIAFLRISPRAILIMSFVILILLGTLLLQLPTATRQDLSWIDALFTSTSAVCVTGLIVVDTPAVFTPTGLVILLGLFQVGGLGLMTFAYFFVRLFGNGLTIRDRSLLLEFLNEENIGRVGGSLIAIVTMTFVFEFVGALVLSWAAPATDWFASVFHAVSAFCNAGFSVYSDGLHDPLTRQNGGYQAVIMMLIVIGGLGFPVLKNLWDHWTARLVAKDRRPPRLTTHSKIVLVTSGALIVGGAVAFYGVEFHASRAAGESPGWLAALFMSVTARTAGYNTVPIGDMGAAAVALLMGLMLIGGSPASTAGGIKTTTFAVALLNTVRILRDPNQELVAFGRQIPALTSTRAFAVALLAVSWVAGATVLLLWLLPEQAPLDVAFEAVSAFCTVGLSRGITAELTTPAKLVLIASMIVGRIGILYVALGVIGRTSPGRLRYPEGGVIIS